MTPNATIEHIMMNNEPGNTSPPPMFDDERHKNTENQNTEGWSVMYSQSTHGMTARSIVEYKTRLEPLSQTFPNSLYAPIIYQMHVTVKLTPDSPALLQNQQFVSKWNELEFVMAKVRVMNGHNHDEQILKNGKPIISGMLKVPLTKQRTTSGNELIFFGHNKIQFLDCSYHHNKQSFALEWSFYLPNELNHPILVVVSTPFKVYARKPNKKRKDVGNTDADMQQENEAKDLKRKRGDNEKIYELQLTKHGQQDGVPVPQVDLTNDDTETSIRQDSPANSFVPIDAQPLKKRVRLMNDVEDGARQYSPERERDPSPTMVEDTQRVSPNFVLTTTQPVGNAYEEEREFQERLNKLLECVKSRRNMSCVQVVISSMMSVASDLYREAGVRM
jgi:hypothetical protein